jgi:hypothetical protein
VGAMVLRLGMVLGLGLNVGDEFARLCDEVPLYLRGAPARNRAMQGTQSTAWSECSCRGYFACME